MKFLLTFLTVSILASPIMAQMPQGDLIRRKDERRSVTYSRPALFAILGTALGGLYGGWKEKSEKDDCEKALQIMTMGFVPEANCDLAYSVSESALKWGAGGMVMGYFLGYIMDSLEERKVVKTSFKKSMFNRPILIRPQVDLKYGQSGPRLSLVAKVDL